MYKKTTDKKEAAKILRTAMTEAEKIMWNSLRGRQIMGIKFRRQFPIGKFIVDLVSLEKMLVIEIDGGGHNTEQEIVYDEQRTKFLTNKGFKVLRFWNDEVRGNLEGVVEKIIFELE